MSTGSARDSTGPGRPETGRTTNEGATTVKLGESKLKGGLSAHYDKVLAFGVLILLLVSALYLALSVSSIRKDLVQFDDMLRRLIPQHESAEPVNVERFEAALDMIERPVKILSAESRIMVAEIRVTCVNPQCLKPIPYFSSACPFCRTDQPPPPPKDDQDRDGMKDSWERRYGLNPRSPDDAAMDRDRDGYTNIEEFMGDTDPTDARDTPSAVHKLRVRAIESVRFSLRFEGASKLAGGVLLFHLKGARNRSYFKKMNEDVASWTIVKYEEKKAKEEKRGILRTVDRSVLTLKRGAKTVELVSREDIVDFDRKATLVLLLDQSEYVVEKGDTFTLRDGAYKVIDIADDLVKIENSTTGAEFDVRREEKLGSGTGGDEWLDGGRREVGTGSEQDEFQKRIRAEK